MFFGLPVYTPTYPSVDEIYNFIDGKVLISDHPNSNVVTFSIHLKSPKVGEDILLSLHEMADDFLRSKDFIRAEKNIEFLDKKLATINQKDIRVNLINQLSEQRNILMKASNEMSYVSEPLGQPFSSPVPTHPNGGIIIFTFILMGSIFGIILNLLVQRIKGKN